ncbi:cilia- and flagella-associated protein 221 [Poecilia reticulata]|uniref:Cilia and flagella associated protein 221 n=1 Tax=Poecilia reticulata TaxID=8081 RepID=A0A3P9NT76_POERE|nr:PREDICTED: cilia- and flagella-associated protein 221 [Poecilia reticulata]XP_008426451.1 PREDICTED: cilia- and flagella-associated protein 221 [Poecilia reticulata]XP_008426460.1 PREDICTED: cilia- and flagella-associated protein 221 [Poecilia reticulata]XP_008426468.1 PREDICTED: cilia- and flagella-associated protein 221 [Poecilia reticulata]XP_008426476.1 PREDICTED: cilia- and flagella-associated protein 221 [Poecilia reticulata]XP_017159254.1 PREDICTED: cilia- and flagella-associated pro
MEVAPPVPQTQSETHRKGRSLPLSQLVEETRSKVLPNHLLDSKIYARLKINSHIEAEPPELHFSGFELGKSYTKTVNLINISNAPVNIHIIPTLTKHFQTTYTKKDRLIPGLAYTVNVAFCPDDWCYFSDCIRVHCKDEENLLIPVHAYPVINDLHIPTHINLSAIPLGQSVYHVIPLRCSCPVDFEFQVYIIQPHDAYSIYPVAGVIPANGEVLLTVTFCPLQYETSQFTFQLVISQFKTKPYLCTITGFSRPNLPLRKPHVRFEAPVEDGGHSSPPSSGRKSKQTSDKEDDKLKAVKDEAAVPQPSPMDVCSPGGVTKILIKDTTFSCGSTKGNLNSQVKEVVFMKKVQQVTEEEQYNYIKCQVHLGVEPVSNKRHKRILEERETALQEYMVKKRDERQDEDFAPKQTQLSSKRMLRDNEWNQDEAPVFQSYTSIYWDLKQRILTLFQQAARKVVIRCRMQRRLTSLKKLVDSIKEASSKGNAKDRASVISPDDALPSSFPNSPHEDNSTALRNFVALPVDPIDVTVTAHIPFFNLQVPQHYKLMCYRPASAWEAFSSYCPTTLARPLRAAAPATTTQRNEVQGPIEEGDRMMDIETAGLSFTPPETLIRPFNANPLRIFNPTPGLQTFKLQPKYLESDMEVHLCALPKFALCESNQSGSMPLTSQTHILHYKEATGMNIKQISIPVTNMSSPCRFVDYNTDILPLSAPPLLPGLPKDYHLQLTETSCEGPAIQLTPEMILAEFQLRKAQTPVSSSSLNIGITPRPEVIYTSDINQMQTRLMARLEEFEEEELE